MNCISREMIQKYIDGEATTKEILRIKTHLSECKECSLKIDNQKKLATQVKLAINLLGEEAQHIPPVPDIPEKNRNHAIKNRSIYYVFMAASILVFIFIISKKKPSENHIIMTIEPGFALDVDANRPASKQSLVITVIDSTGNVSEYLE